MESSEYPLTQMREATKLTTVASPSSGRGGLRGRESGGTQAGLDSFAVGTKLFVGRLI